MVRIFAIVLCFFALSTATQLKAEIKEITIKWNAVICLEKCVPLLRQKLETITMVHNLQINARAGTAVMQWNSSLPFSFEPFNFATRAAGVRLADIRLKVIGVVKQVKDKFYLDSLGDQTSFLLLGPIRVTPGQYTIKENVATRIISPELAKRLSILASSGELVEIEGPLFEPFRYLTLLVVEQIKQPKQNRATNPNAEIQKYRLP